MNRRFKSLVKLGLVFLLIGVASSLLGANGKITFTYATFQETMCFDPAKHIDETQSANVFNTYDPLVYPVLGKAPQMWLAKSYEVSQDGLTYTFHLRHGVKFHDGTELTAEDVAFSMDRMLRIKQGFSWLWSGILQPGDTEVVDDYTVAFHLRKPFAPFIATLVQFFVVNKKLLMKNKKPGNFGEYGDYGQGYLEDHDAGSGPYTVSSVVLGDHIVFQKFKDYWRGWKPNQIDTVIWRVIPERATLDTMLKKGDVDMIDQWGTPQEYNDLAKVPGVVVDKAPNVQLFVIQMNNKKKPLDDVNVRKAISYAFDYKTAVEDIFMGGKQAEGPVPILIPGHNPDVVVYHRDLNKAREYLKKSKYSLKELKKMTLTYTYVTGSELERKIGLLLMSDLQELGLNVKVEKAVWGTICDMAAKPETTPHFTAIFHTAKYPSPDSHTYLMFNRNAWGTYISMSWYDNPVVDELTEKARVTLDTEKRYKIYGEVQKIVTEDAAALFVANPTHRIAYRSYVKGYKMRGVLAYDLTFYNLTIEK